jgi:hypothetical protein
MQQSTIYVAGWIEEKDYFTYYDVTFNISGLLTYYTAVTFGREQSVVLITDSDSGHSPNWFHWSQFSQKIHLNAIFPSLFLFSLLYWSDSHLSGFQSQDYVRITFPSSQVARLVKHRWTSRFCFVHPKTDLVYYCLLPWHKIFKIRDAQVPCPRSPGRLNFLRWCLIFVAPQYGTCGTCHPPGA